LFCCFIRNYSTFINIDGDSNCEKQTRDENIILNKVNEGSTEPNNRMDASGIREGIFAEGDLKRFFS
jgi:hypothetical protein